MIACSVFGQNEALLRSWRKAYPFMRLSDEAYVAVKTDSLLGKNLLTQTFDTKINIDSILAEVKGDTIDSFNSLSLYDIRMPIFNTGKIPEYNKKNLLDVANDTSKDMWNYVVPADAKYIRQNEAQTFRDSEIYNFVKTHPSRYQYSRGGMSLPPVLDRTMISTEESLEGKSLEVGEEVVAFTSIGGIKTKIKTDVWHKRGSSNIQMTQTALSDNWYKGGDNNMTVATVNKLDLTTYDENKKTSFDVALELRLSALYTKADTVNSMRVNDNLFSANIKYGYKAWKRWYYSSSLYARTPIFDYHDANSSETKSTFLAPLEMNISVGLEYKYVSPSKKVQYSLLLAPVAYNMKYVSTDRVNETYYGIGEGKSSLHKFGSTISQQLTWQMSNSVSLISRLYGFTSYDNIQIEFENTFNFNVSRHFACQLYLYPRFDDMIDSRIQIKEMLSFGLNYVW